MTSTLLKIIALIFMTIDHIGQFFPASPIWFRWIGRLSAPIFLFVFVYSLSYTKSRKKLLTRLYICNIFMTCIGIFLNSSAILGSIIGEFNNNIFGTFFAIALLIMLTEYIRDRRPHWKKFLTGYIALQLITTTVAVLLIFAWLDPLALAVCQLTANIFLNEGRLYFVLLGIVLYHIKDRKKDLIIYYSVLVFTNSAIILSGIMPRISDFLSYRSDILFEVFERIIGVIGFETVIWDGLSPLYDHFEWMAIGALPFFLLYNGKKGAGYKYIFYIYYPLHIIILAALCYYFII